MRYRRRASSNADVDLDRYAEITAHVRHFPEDKADEVVARLGVSPAGWQAAASRWSRTLEATADAGRADMMQRYAASLARTKRRLASLQPTIESLGPLPEPGPDEAPPEPLPAPALDHLPAPSEPLVAVPSYLSSPSAGGPPVPAFMKASAWAAPAPLAPVASPLVAPPAADPPGAEPAVHAAPIPPVAAAVSMPDLPPPPSPASRPPAPRPRTLAMPVAAPAPEQLPFKPTDTTAEEAVQRAVAHALAVQGPAPDKPSSLGATAADISEIVRGPLPFARSPAAAPPRPIPEYTVERYASLKVELREYAERSAEVLARYKLDAETAAALDDDWKRRMNADSSLRGRFLDACERYRAWLRSRDASSR